MKYLPVETRLFAHAASSLLDRPVGEPEVEPFLDEVGRTAPAHVSWGLRGILWLAWASPLVAQKRAATFDSISHEERAEIWSVALDHPAYPIRQLALTAKAMVCLCLLDEKNNEPVRGAR